MSEHQITIKLYLNNDRPTIILSNTFTHQDVVLSDPESTIYVASLRLFVALAQTTYRMFHHYFDRPQSYRELSYSFTVSVEELPSPPSVASY